LNNPTHFQSVRALLRAQIVRQDLAERWERLISVYGGPTPADLGDRPELVCRQFVPAIQNCLEWHASVWLALESQFRQAGFRWASYLQSVPPQTGNNAELHRLRDAVLGELESILKARAGWLRLQQLQQILIQWRALVPHCVDTAEAVVTSKLRQAF